MSLFSANTSVLKQASKIMTDTTLDAGKKATDLGSLIKSEAAVLNPTPNTKAAMLNIGKWGGMAAATGIGAGLGVGGGSVLAGAGISHAFGLDFSTEEKTEESVKKVSGWAIFLIVAVVAVWFLWPRIKQAVR